MDDLGLIPDRLRDLSRFLGTLRPTQRPLIQRVQGSFLGVNVRGLEANH